MDGESAGFHQMHARYTLERTRKNVNKGNPDKANPTAVVGNTGYTLESANDQIYAGFADMITFGRPYMSNPDLPERFAKGIPLEPELPRQYWWKHAVRVLE